MKKLYIIGAAACLLSACHPNVKVTPNPTKGNANFTTYLAVGNSLTAGYADGSLYLSGQLNSYPERLFEQFQSVGSDGKFIQPLLKTDFGFPGPKFIMAVTTHCDGSTSLGPAPYAGHIDTTGNIEHVSGHINNIGVPGIRIADYDVASYATIAYYGGGAPYAYRFYNNVAGTPQDELIYRVNDLQPTFFTCWLGANDVLGYATSGGQGNGDGTAVPLGANLYANGDITPDSVFKHLYDAAVTVLINNGAKGVLINIPDVTSIPYFTAIPAKGLILRQGQADTLNAIYAGHATFVAGANYFVITDHDGHIRNAFPNELIMLTTPQDSLLCAGWGSVKPIPAAYVLDQGEIQNAQKATAFFNSVIKDEAAKHNLVYVDMNAYLKTLSSGITFGGVTYTAQFVTGGAFSLDGVHLTPRGYALAANQIINSINAFYHSTIPTIDVNKYDGVKFP